MNKNNKILLGIILVMIGIYFLTQSIFDSKSASNVIFIGSGVALIFLYLTKRKGWAFVSGVYILWYGIVSFIIKTLNIQNVFIIWISSLFILTSAIFMLAYKKRAKKELLLPACLLFWFGIYNIFRYLRLFSVNEFGISLFLVCLGFAFISAFFIGNKTRWMLYSAIFFISFSIIITLSKYEALTSFFQPLVAVVIILFGATLLFNAFKKKNKN